MENCKLTETKFILFVLLLCLIGCKSSNQVKDLIKGNWKLTNNNNSFSIKITTNEYTVENDSPIPEDYWISGDSIIVKGFEAASGGSVDSMKIIKLTEDTLMLKDNEDTLIFFKR